MRLTYFFLTSIFLLPNCKGKSEPATKSKPVEAKPTEASDVPVVSDLGIPFSSDRVATLSGTPPKGSIAVLAGPEAKGELANAVHTFSFYDDGKHIAAIYLDDTVRLWNVAKSEQHAKLTFKHSVSGIAYAPTTKHFYVATKAPRFVELGTDGSPLREITSLPKGIKSIGVLHKGLKDFVGYMSVAGSTLVSGLTGYLVIDLPSFTPTHYIGYEPEREDGPSVAMCVKVVDNNRVLWQGEDGDSAIYALKTAKTLQSFPDFAGSISEAPYCDISQDGSTVALAGGRLALYDTTTGEQILLIDDESISAVAMSRDGSLVAYNFGEQGKVAVLAKGEKKPKKIWQACPDSHFDYLALSADGGSLAVACDGNIVVWPTN